MQRSAAKRQVCDFPRHDELKHIGQYAILPTPMKLALNGATTMRADLETDIKVAAQAGFEFLEIWAAKLREFLKHNSPADLRQLLQQHHVQPLSINSIEHVTFRDDQAYESIKEQCRELSEVAAIIGCPYIVVVPGRIPESGATRAEVIDESVRVLNELCDIAEQHGIALAFEFLGQLDCTVQTLDLAHEVVRTANRKNLALVIDSFHFYAGGSTIEMIESLDPNLVAVFHINDAEDRSKAELNDSHLLLPGLGILPLRAMLGAFNRIGYDKVASIEIFRPEYWDMDPYQLGRDAREATLKVIAAVPESRESKAAN